MTAHPGQAAKTPALSSKPLLRVLSAHLPSHYLLCGVGILDRVLPSGSRLTATDPIYHAMQLDLREPVAGMRTQPPDR
jgi:hypothetical protein